MNTEHATDRNPIERIGLLVLAFGVFMATLLAWLLTKVDASWATQTGVHVPHTTNIRQSLAGTYFYERHIAAQGAFYIGAAFVVVGTILILVGKATGPKISGSSG